jgi:rubrerythrin
MKLAKYELEEIILSAIRSEIEANELYRTLARHVRNAFMKDKLVFLAGEEEKHRKYLVGLYRKQFPRKKLAVPLATSVPLLPLKMPDPVTPRSEVIEKAMAAEKAASDFYTSFAGRFEPGSDEERTLTYFSIMEQGHLKLLDIERELMVRQEYYEAEWPMMHAGP